MRAQFVRGGNPLDKLDIGDVKGRKIAALYSEIKSKLEKLIKEEKLSKKSSSIQDDSNEFCISLGFSINPYSYYIHYYKNKFYSNPLYAVWEYRVNGQKENGGSFPCNTVMEAITNIKHWIKA